MGAPGFLGSTLRALGNERRQLQRQPNQAIDMQPSSCHMSKHAAVRKRFLGEAGTMDTVLRPLQTQGNTHSPLHSPVALCTALRRS